MAARVLYPFDPAISEPESMDLRWIPVDDVAGIDLHPAFAASWPELRGRLLDGTGPGEAE